MLNVFGKNEDGPDLLVMMIYVYSNIWAIASPFNPLPHMHVFGSSNSAANENMMSKIWTNGVQLSDWVENIVEIEGIARYEQFLFFP